MKKILLVLSICMILQTSCKKEDILKNKSGEITSMPHMWSKPFQSYNTSYEYPFYYKNNVIRHVTSDTSNYFASINAETGDYNWKIASSTYSNEYADDYFNQTYVYENFLAVPVASTVLKFDLNNGNLIGHIYFNFGINEESFYGMGKDFFISKQLNGGIYYHGDLNTFTQDSVFEKQYRKDEIVFSRTYFNNNKQYIFEGYNRNDSSFISLFDVKESQFIYNNTCIATDHLLMNGFIEGDMLFCKSENSMSIDIISGTTIWKKNDSYFGTKILQYNSSVISSSENNGIIAIDSNNGNILWQQKDLEGSNIQELNGIIYFEFGNLFALDAKTGKILWRINGEDSMFSSITVVPGINGKKGKVIATTGTKIYCYEAIQ